MSILKDVLKSEIQGRVFYFGLIPSELLHSCLFVPVLEESPRNNNYVREQLDRENNYQRPGSRSRQRKFSEFLKEHGNSVVPPIVLSTRGGWVFESDGDESTGTLEIQSPAAIIDGQHRAGGFICRHGEDEQSRPVPFIAIPNLTLTQEKDEFLVINTTQKGVPKSQGVFLTESAEQEVANLLNTEDGVFKDRLSIARKARHHLWSFNQVVKSIKELFSHGKFSELSVDTKHFFFEKYWEKIKEACAEEWEEDYPKLDDPESRGRNDFEYKLLETTGLIAWCDVGSQVLSNGFEPSTGSMNWEFVKTCVEDLANMDWAKDGKYSGWTGTVGARKIVEDMEMQLPAFED